MVNAATCYLTRGRARVVLVVNEVAMILPDWVMEYQEKSLPVAEFF